MPKQCLSHCGHAALSAGARAGGSEAHTNKGHPATSAPMPDVKKNKAQRSARRRAAPRQRRPAATPKHHAAVGPEPNVAPAIKAELRARSPNDDVYRLLLSHVLPLSAAPVRHSDPYGARPTALGKPWAQLDAPWFNRPAPAAHYPSNYDIDKLLIIEQHDPRAFLMVTDFTPARLKVDGVADADITNAMVWETDGNGVGIRTMRAGDWYNPSAATVTGGTSGYVKHGGKLYARQFGDQSALLVNTAPNTGSWTASRLVISNNTGVFAANTTYNFTVRVFTLGGYRDLPITFVGNGTNTQGVTLSSANLPKLSWINASYRGAYLTASGPAATDPSPLDLAFLTQETCDGVCVYPVPGLVANENVVDELRILGQAVMYTNDAAHEFRAGKRAQYQSGGAVPADSYFLASNIYTNVANNQGAESEDLVEGAHSWRRPSGMRDWDMLPFDGPADNVGAGLFFGTPPQTADYLCMALSAPPPGAGAAAAATAQVGRITYGCGVEYETEDTWRTIEPPEMDEDRYSRAMPILRTITQHTTNKSHLTLAKVLRGVLGVARIGRPVLAALGKTNPYAAAGAQVVDALTRLHP